MISFFTSIPTKINNYQVASNNQQVVKKYPNLAPLAYDTVSFGMTPKNLTETCKQFGISKEEAVLLSQDAVAAKNYLENQLNDVLGDLVKPEGECKVKNKPIYSIKYRVKTPDSIMEKAQTRRLINVDEVKSGLTDLVGAKIILEDSSTKSVDKILSRLTDAERDNKLRIVEIESYRPEPEIDENGNILQSYEYGSANALRKLKSECDKKGQSISKRDEDVPTGYMAIHLLTELPNGFTGEIQIMGKNVANLKNIEDLCYKYKSGKEIAKNYKPICKQLAPLKNKDDILLKREFNKYTREAYKYERLKEEGKVKDKQFLKIPNYLPLQLDFNKINETKIKCEAA